MRGADDRRTRVKAVSTINHPQARSPQVTTPPLTISRRVIIHWDDGVASCRFQTFTVPPFCTGNTGNTGNINQKCSKDGLLALFIVPSPYINHWEQTGNIQPFGVHLAGPQKPRGKEDCGPPRTAPGRWPLHNNHQCASPANSASPSMA